MAGFEGFPVLIGWELTLACNLRCRHCASSAGDARLHELTLDEALAVCEQLPPLLVQEVVFTGGEPLLSPHLFPLAQRLKQLEINVGMVTNGILLHDAAIGHLQDVGMEGLAISLDGLQKTHDDIRGIPGLFDRTFANLGSVLQAGMDVTIITTVNSRSIKELPAMLPLLQAAGVKRWQLQPLFTFGRTLDHMDLHLSLQDYVTLGLFIRDHQAQARSQGMNILGADGVGYFSDIVAQENPWKGCSAGICSCGIMSDGRIKGCLSWPDHLAEGSLRENSLWDIWFREDAFASTRHILKEDLGGACRDCEKGEICGGGCSAISIASTGSLHADPYCFRAISRVQDGCEIAMRNGLQP